MLQYGILTLNIQYGNTIGIIIFMYATGFFNIFFGNNFSFYQPLADHSSQARPDSSSGLRKAINETPVIGMCV